MRAFNVDHLKKSELIMQKALVLIDIEKTIFRNDSLGRDSLHLLFTKTETLEIWMMTMRLLVQR